MVASAPKGVQAAGEAQASPASMPPSSKRRSQGDPPASDVERKNEPAKAWVLVVDDEPELLRGVCRGLKALGYSVTEARNGEEAVQHLSRRAFDVVVSDIVMPGMGGIQLLKEIRQHDLHVPVVLMTGAPAVSTAVQALEYGAFHYLTKPVESDALDQIVQKAVRMHRMARVKQQAAELLGHAGALGADRAGLEASFNRAMQSMWIAYHPIVDVRKKTIFGYEALLRSTEPSLPHPGAVIDAAMRLGRIESLGRAIRSLAAEPVPADQNFAVFVNLHVTDLTDPALSDPESPLSKIASRVVLEITERSSLDEVRDARRRVAALREMGFRIAVDDLGAGYAGLSSFTLLEPEIVKLDMSLIRDIHITSTKQKVVRSMTALSKDMGMIVVAEGVETREECDCLLDLGCDLLQGFLFAKPGRAFPGVSW
ncbi:MAG TPA: EAL domain-containing protein [Polyangiaceae bacterium]|nr:EAL domain-containing protein [Polyangiaceae bacterium]